MIREYCLHPDCLGYARIVTFFVLHFYLRFYVFHCVHLLRRKIVVKELSLRSKNWNQSNDYEQKLWDETIFWTGRYLEARYRALEASSVILSIYQSRCPAQNTFSVWSIGATSCFWSDTSIHKQFYQFSAILSSLPTPMYIILCLTIRAEAY